MRTTLRGLIALAVCAGAGLAHAQAWPNKPVKWSLAASAGSAPDIVARLIADRLTQMWGQQIIIDNKPGAGGIVGTAAGANAEPDGYNMLFAQAAPIVSSPFLFKQLGYNPEKDLVPIVSLGISPMMIAVHPAVKANSLAELVALAKAEPGKLNFGTPGSKNVPHMTGLVFADLTGMTWQHVAYKTTPQAASDAMAGITQVYINGVPTIAPMVKNGRLRVIAVSSLKRLPNYPELAAMSEVAPGFSMVGWFGLMAPTGTPAGVLARVNKDTNAVLNIPIVAERMLQLGMYDPGGSAEEFGRFIVEERARWSSAAKAAKFELE
ncbi:MAG: tripartite tricarboxylate transporter substrate-binding protein [Burkholderiales bacterium]